MADLGRNVAIYETKFLEEIGEYEVPIEWGSSQLTEACLLQEEYVLVLSRASEHSIYCLATEAQKYTIMKT